jgi:Rod binding domain-containing protein
MQPILATTTAAGNSTTPQPRLVKAAHEFEAQMMKELMKPLSHSSALTGTDTDDDSGSAGALGEFASEALGKALSERGGFGIASSIIKHLSTPAARNGTVSVIGNLPMNTVIRSEK